MKTTTMPKRRILCSGRIVSTVESDNGFFVIDNKSRRIVDGEHKPGIHGPYVKDDKRFSEILLDTETE